MAESAPPSTALVLALAPDATELRRCSTWLEQICREQGVPDAQISRLDLCLHEVLANLLDHGGASTSSTPVEVKLQLAGRGESRSASLTVVDGGKPFDPRLFQSRELPRSLQEAIPGGLGLLMVRRFSDALSYCRSGETNALTVTVCWSASA